SGVLEGEVRADRVDLEASGHSRADLHGSGKDLKVKASGGCILELADLAADNADIDLSDACMAKVQAKARLDYSLRRAAQLHYRGSPVLGRQERSGSALIVH